MKLYEKIINGKQHCKPASKIVIIKDGMQTFNPTEEMLLEDGWKIHEPISYELTDEEILNIEKEHKIEDILRYDSSQEVNIFYIGEQLVWLDKATRAGLKLRFESEGALGDTETTLWYKNMQFPLNIEQAIRMLYVIEKYASACYDNTQRHLAAVDLLEDVDAIKAYNYREGYPEKLKF